MLAQGIVEQGYPITLCHPQHKAAKLVQGDEMGEPERFPAVTVNGAVQESQYRALGYLRFGEPAPQKTDHHEFPKTLRHPGYVPETPSRVEMRVENGKPVGTYTIPAVPAVMPDLTVMNEDQEVKAREAGYKPAGEYNPVALRAVLNGTADEEIYEPEEYPKWVDGVLVERDPAAPLDLSDPRQYPKVVDGRVVSDPNVPPPVDPNEFPKWIHRNGIPSDTKSKLANNPIEEAAIRSVWAREEEELEKQAKIAAKQSKSVSAAT